MSAGGGRDAERHIQLSHGDAEQQRSASESRVCKGNNGGNLVVWSGFDKNPLILDERQNERVLVEPTPYNEVASIVPLAHPGLRCTALLLSVAVAQLNVSLSISAAASTHRRRPAVRLRRACGGRDPQRSTRLHRNAD